MFGPPEEFLEELTRLVSLERDLTDHDRGLEAGWVRSCLLAVIEEQDCRTRLSVAGHRQRAGRTSHGEDTFATAVSQANTWRGYILHLWAGYDTRIRQYTSIAPLPLSDGFREDAARWHEAVVRSEEFDVRQGTPPTDERIWSLGAKHHRIESEHLARTMVHHARLHVIEMNCRTRVSRIERQDPGLADFVWSQGQEAFAREVDLHSRVAENDALELQRSQAQLDRLGGARRRARTDVNVARWFDILGRRATGMGSPEAWTPERAAELRPDDIHEAAHALALVGAFQHTSKEYESSPDVSAYDAYRVRAVFDAHIGVLLRFVAHATGGFVLPAALDDAVGTLYEVAEQHGLSDEERFGLLGQVAMAASGRIDLLGGPAFVAEQRGPSTAEHARRVMAAYGPNLIDATRAHDVLVPAVGAIRQGAANDLLLRGLPWGRLGTFAVDPTPFSATAALEEAVGTLVEPYVPAYVAVAERAAKRVLGEESEPTVALSGLEVVTGPVAAPGNGTSGGRRPAGTDVHREAGIGLTTPFGSMPG